MAQQVAPAPKHNLSDGGLNAIVNSIVFSFLATIAVGLRFYVRRVKRKGVFVEDWLILTALILNWSYSIIVLLLAFDGGLGWESNQLTPSTLERASKYSLAGQTTWPIANGLIKTSICLTFIRIFVTRPFRIAATTVYILCIGWSVANILVGYLICTPLSKVWIQTPEGHCGNTSAAYLAPVVLDVILDIAVFSLPLPMLYRLKIAKHAKIALVATFGLGICTIVAGIMRLVAVVQITSTDYLADVSKAEVGDEFWSSIESSVGIVVACSMTLRPLLDQLLTALQRHFGQFHKIRNSRGPTTYSLPTTHTETTDNSASFVILHDNHRELPFDGPQSSQKGSGGPTKRASFELV